MLILYPKLPNGNIRWSCDNCDNTTEVSMVDTNAVALVCICDGKIRPQCNSDWYCNGLYWNRIPIERRDEYRKLRKRND